MLFIPTLMQQHTSPLPHTPRTSTVMPFNNKPSNGSTTTVEKDDDNASIRTTGSTFSALGARGRRWSRALVGANNAEAMQSNSTLLPSYDDAKDEAAASAAASSSSASTSRTAFKSDYKRESARHNTCNLNEDDEDDAEGPPSRVVIDNREMDAFVALSETEAHLTLLTAFRDVRSRCYMQASTTKEQESVWSTYLRRATYRLSLYLDTVLRPIVEHAQGSQQDLWKCEPHTLLSLSRSSAKQHASRTMLALPDDALPPLDVAMAWHAYLLNPGRYTEDIARLASRRHLHMIKFPLLQLAQCVKFTPSDGPVLDVSAACMQRWQVTTATPFTLTSTAPPLSSPLDERGAPPLDEGLLVSCPFCARGEATVENRTSGCVLSWDTLNGEKDWKATCAACRYTLSPGILRNCLFTKDVEVWLQKQPTPYNAGLSFYMRGGLLSARNGRLFDSDPHAPVLCRLFPYQRIVRPTDNGMMALMSRLNPDDPDCIEGLPSHVLDVPRNDLRPTARPHDDIDRMAQLLNQACQERLVLKYEDTAVDLQRRVALLMRLYLDADVLVPDCSLDIAEAVKRQFSFVEEMDRLGWLDTATFAKGKGADAQPALLPQQRRPLLARAIVRYHRWLNVLAVRNELLCPTLDIDLAWHTHQLQPSYYADCFTATDMFIDHDDKIDASTLGDAFDNTATLWYEMYKQPYSVCGCPVHTGSKSSIRASLRTLKNNLASRPKPAPGVTDMHHELNPVGRQRADASHPSAHNAVIAPKSVHDVAWLRMRAAKQERHWQTGLRDQGHGDVFIKGHGRTPLKPYEHIPSTSCGVPGKCVTGGAEAEARETGPSRCVGVREVIKPTSKGRWDVMTTYDKSDGSRSSGGHFSTAGASSKIANTPSLVTGSASEPWLSKVSAGGMPATGVSGFLAVGFIGGGACGGGGGGGGGGGC